MKKNGFVLLFTAFLMISASGVHSWELFDRVVAVVNTTSIIESELNSKLLQANKLKPFPPGRLIYEKSRMLDRMIEDALITETAKSESILVSDTKILIYIERVLKDYLYKTMKADEADKLSVKIIDRLKIRLVDENLKPDPKVDPVMNQFIAYIEAQNKTSFFDFIEDIRIQMMREQVMTTAIGVTPPSRQEALKWYNQNIDKVGFEVNFKHILIKPQNSSFAEEKRTARILEDLRNRIAAGASFEAMARQYSQDSSAAKGGDMGWVLIQELDLYLGMNLYQMTSGQLSGVFKSGYGYHIVKFNGRRQASFDKVERFIMMKLYSDSMMGQFQKWVAKKKMESDIQIFLKEYIKG